MSGHNKWTKIKHKKTADDQARSKLFSKLANEISIAARGGADPDFNPTLRSAMDRARRQNMPQENIQRAVKRASDAGSLQSLLVEAYGPEGVGIVIEANTDNRNRAISELRSILKEFDLKVADPGSLMWSFEKIGDGYKAKFSPQVSSEAKERISSIKGALRKMGDVVEVYTSID